MLTPSDIDTIYRACFNFGAWVSEQILIMHGPDHAVRDHLVRVAVAMPDHIAQANAAPAGAERTRHFAIACMSARETCSSLELLRLTGTVPAQDIVRARTYLECIEQLLRKVISTPAGPPHPGIEKQFAFQWIIADPDVYYPHGHLHASASA